MACHSYALVLHNWLLWLWFRWAYFSPIASHHSRAFTKLGYHLQKIWLRSRNQNIKIQNNNLAVNITQGWVPSLVLYILRLNWIVEVWNPRGILTKGMHLCQFIDHLVEASPLLFYLGYEWQEASHFEFVKLLLRQPLGLDQEWIIICVMKLIIIVGWNHWWYYQQ